MAESYPITHEQGNRICLEHVPVGVPRYATYHTSIIATGKLGTGPGELGYPYGITIHEDTHQIFVVNAENGRVEVFSETGDFLYQLGVGQLSGPWGIAIHGDSVYVGCDDHTISKFSLTEMCHVKRIGGYGSNNGQFSNPSQLTTDPIGRVFIPDTNNHRICIHDPDLNHLRTITLQSMSEPIDVKVSGDCLYVLCQNDNPCIQVLTLEGDKLHSLITCGEEMDVLGAFCFCFDPLNNILISDFYMHLIRVFSPEGNLLHTIGREGHKHGMFYHPAGVSITPNGRLVCVAENENYCLQIFY